LEFRWKGAFLPYSAIDKHKRVIHAPVSENKTLAVVVEHIKIER
jgi:hypothetical protein